MQREHTAQLFSVDNLDVFNRPGATVTKRDDGRAAGCWVKFNNRWTMSIQWGCGNYGSNYDRGFEDDPLDATQAEIAVWQGENRDLVTWRDGDTVQGWCSMERVQGILDLLAEDKLMREYQPPVELRADDGWSDDA